MSYKQIFQSIIQLVVISIVFILLVFLVKEVNQDKILQNKEDFLLKQLNQLVSGYNNNILEEKYTKVIKLYNKETAIIVYPAKRNGEIFATLVEHIYPGGYSGDIKILTALDNQNKIIGARVLEHKETPGLGDKIEVGKSDWILSFDNLTTSNKDSSFWQVKKYGGNFDSFTGATITPQAVITAIYELVEAFKVDNEN